MQIYINGDFLDLYDDDLSFERINSIFDLKKAYADKSYTFKVPATDRNNSIFGNCNMICTTGSFARRKTFAQLQLSGYTIDGYLYVVSCNATEYDCCFIFGNGSQFKQIFEEMTLQDLFAEEDGYIVNTGQEPSSGTGVANSFMRWYNYENGQDYHLPSVLVGKIFERLQTKISITGISQDIYNLAIVANNFTTHKDNTTFNVVFKSYPETQTTDYLTCTNDVYFSFRQQGMAKDILQIINIRRNLSVDDKWMYGFLALTDVTLTFPQDFPDDTFLIGGEATNSTFDAKEIYNKNDGTYFLGNYYFNTSIDTSTVKDFGTPTGTPLAGRDVKINRNTLFQFVIPAGANIKSIEVKQNIDEYQIIVDRSGDMPVGVFNRTHLYLVDYVPKIKVYDFLQAIANIYGYSLRLQGNGVVFVKNVNVRNYNNISNSIISTGDITRTFNDYAQINKVAFPDNDGKNAKNEVIYTITNATLDDTKDIFEIPFNNGNDSNGYLAIEDITYKVEDKDEVQMVSIKSDAKNFAIGRTGMGSEEYEYMLYIGDLQRNIIIDNLCRQSTKITARALMTLEDFCKLAEDKTIYINGFLFVWTKIQWSGGVATFTLQKVA